MDISCRLGPLNVDAGELNMTGMGDVLLSNRSGANIKLSDVLSMSNEGYVDISSSTSGINIASMSRVNISTSTGAGVWLSGDNVHFVLTGYQGSDVGYFGHSHCAVDVPFHVHDSENMFVTTTIYPSGITLTNPATTADMVKIKSYGSDAVYGGILQLYGNDSNYDHTITLQECKLTLDLGGYNVSISPAPMGEPCYISTTCGGFEFNEYFRLPAFTKSVDKYDGTVTYDKAGYVNFRIIKTSDDTYSIEIVKNT